MDQRFIKRFAQAAHAAAHGKSLAEIDAVARRVLEFLKTRRLLKQMPAILSALAAIDRGVRGVLRATLESRYPLTAGEQAQIRSLLEKRFNSKIELEKQIHPELVGGFRIRCGDTVLDGTVRENIKQLMRHLEASYVIRPAH